VVRRELSISGGRWIASSSSSSLVRCETLDDIAKDHVTHTDRRADGSGQNKVDTDDRQHGCSLGNEIPLHVWNTDECNNCTVTFGTSLVQLPLRQAPKRGNDPVNCVSVPSALTVSGWREGGIGSRSVIAIFRQLRRKPFLSGVYWPHFGDSVKQGWYGDDYLILFNEPEASLASDSYGISQVLPGFKVIGLRGWDDFILQDSEGATYSVPTVPAIPTHLSPYALPPAGLTLASDDRFQNKIKWYVKPVVFGGDPQLGANVVWVSHDEHTQLVKYWNDLYRSVKNQ